MRILNSKTSTKVSRKAGNPKEASVPARDLLVARSLSFSYDKQLVIRNVDLNLAAGEILMILGLSGSGKTTLLKLLSGLELPKAGSITLDGNTLFDKRSSVAPNKRGMSFVFQDFALFPHFTVFENVAFGLAQNHKERKIRTQEALGLLRIEALAQKYPHQLSGGQKQRVGLARALVMQPRVILMDEPFSQLDRPLRETVCDRTIHLMRNISAAVIIVTHDAAEALKFADRVAVLDEGRIVQVGSPHELFSSPNSALVARLISETNVWRMKVKGGNVDTPFGRRKLPAKLKKEIGSAQEIEAIIPQHGFVFGEAALPSGLADTLDSQSVTVRVQDARAVGAETLVHCALPWSSGRKSNNWHVHVKVSGKFHHKVGQWVQLKLRDPSMLRFVKADKSHHGKITTE